MRILFVSPYIPSPIRVRPYQWIRALARLGHRVRLVALRPPEDRWLADVPVRDCCESVTVFPLSRRRTLANAVWALPRRLPLQAAYSLHEDAELAVAAESAQCDVVHVEHLRGALLARRLPPTGPPRVIDAVDSITTLFEQTLAHAPNWRHRLMAKADLPRTRVFEAGLPRLFDRVVVSAPGDATRFRTLSGAGDAARIAALPNGVDLDHFRSGGRAPDPGTVLFTGKMSYHANAAAAVRLVERVMPRVWQERPDARVVIAGKDPGPAIRRLARDSRVTVTGFVDDLRPLFWSATLVAAPLVYGAGIQNKVLEAMACGVPVVASPTACDALSAVPGQDLLVGRDDGELARHTLALLASEGLRRAVAGHGRRYVSVHHDWSRLASALVGVYESAGAARRCA
jgi:glycosyltransferase involved in cell wall biosynthesis